MSERRSLLMADFACSRARPLPTGVLVLAAWCAAGPVAAAQRGLGELRVHVTDETGLPVAASGLLKGAATAVLRRFETDERGAYVAGNLPFDRYEIEVSRQGFSPATARIDVGTEVPIDVSLTLRVAPVEASVEVSAAAGAPVDRFRLGSVEWIGPDRLRDRTSSVPGRSVIELVNQAPGWLLEANGILHPRGAEYQVQYVIDGIPLRDNRSPAFTPLIDAGDVESLRVRTGGYPAEFGDKLGGIIEVNTVRDARQGLHGRADLQAGSDRALTGFVSAQYGTGRTSAGAAVAGLRTDRYLDPPVVENYTNHGGAGDVSLRADRAWSDAARTRASAHRQSATFLVPNEALQEAAGQRQTRSADETLVQISHQQVMAPRLLGSVRAMARDSGATLESNAASTPIRPFQDRRLREAYVNGDLVVHTERHDLKVGGEAAAGSVEESFQAAITAYAIDGVPVFDAELPASFAFRDRRASREEALFVQDVVRLGPATVSAGLRYDRYRLAVEDQALSPRVAASWYVEDADLLVRAAYDRVFQTPATENVLLSSANVVGLLGGQGSSLPLRPSRGHFSEVGASKSIGAHLRVDGTAYYRTADNFADDDLLLNTAVSFPISFSHGSVRGVEIALESLGPGPADWSVNYTYSVGTGYLPVSGGLFLGERAAALLESRGAFPLSQDQRHTMRGRLRARLGSRGIAAAAAQFNSGLPVELDAADPALLAAQYGPAVVERVDFEAERVRPSWSVDGSIAWSILERGGRTLRVHADVFNVFDRLNVINFAGLFSGTAIAPGRTWAVRLSAEF